MTAAQLKRFNRALRKFEHASVIYAFMGTYDPQNWSAIKANYFQARKELRICVSQLIRESKIKS